MQTRNAFPRRGSKLSRLYLAGMLPILGSIRTLGVSMIGWRNRDELKEDFKKSGEDDYLAWLSRQKEGNPNPPTGIRQEIKESDPAFPNTLAMLKEAAKSVRKAAKDGFKRASKEEQKRRFEICKACDRFDKKQERCRECGCFMVVKVLLEVWHCPLKKW